PCEGRQADSFAFREFDRQESISVACGNGLHHRVIWAPRLHQSSARAILSTGSAGDLGKKLEGALRCPKISTAQTKIAVHDTNEGQVRKVVALRRGLGCDHDVDISPRH